MRRIRPGGTPRLAPRNKSLDIYKISVTLSHMKNNPFVNVQKRMLASERKAAIRLGNRAYRTNRTKTTKKKAFVNPLDWVAASR